MKHQRSKLRKTVKVTGSLALILIVLFSAATLAINSYMKSSVDEYLIADETAAKLDADCILILGAGLKPDGTPNYMLRDRLDKGIELYRDGAAPKLLLSGDNGQDRYDEVGAMRDYALEAGVPDQDIILDPAGFSTYESMCRARDIFLVDKAIIITQEYHQYRALYIARGLGIDAYGAAAKPMVYAGQKYRDAREILARDKDFLKIILKP